jgi:hypothetical protein
VVVAGDVERLAKALYEAAAIRRKVDAPPWDELAPAVEREWLGYADEGLAALNGQFSKAPGPEDLAWAALKGQVKATAAAIRDFRDALSDWESNGTPP